MADPLDDLEPKLAVAVRDFWAARQLQASAQGGDSAEARDRGQRAAVTGGKHLGGFILLVHDILVSAGLASSMIFCKGRPVGDPPNPRPRRGPSPIVPMPTRTELPGWFRAEKDWDLLVIVGGSLVAVVEFKSQVGSFGNNFNNRTEEALGSATDLAAAYREGAFRPSLRPWVGYLMLLEECEASTRPVRPKEPHFKVFEEFRDASYAQRYDLLLTKLVRERLYDSACLLLSPAEGGLEGQFSEPNPELSFRNFITSLVAHATAAAKFHPAPAASVQVETLERTTPPEEVPKEGLDQAGP